VDPRAPFSLNIGRFTTQVFFCTAEELQRELSSTEAFFCFDEHTLELWPGSPRCRAVVPAGEEHKNLRQLEYAAGEAVAAGMSRDSRFIAVGGGVLCDMTALLASLYMRGAPLSLVPTTLLAMVDASVGGKTGIDFRGYKNLLGTFYPAEMVYIVPELLATLPDEEFLGGLAEVIKHGLLGDDQLLKLLEEQRDNVLDRDTDLCGRMIARSLRVKAAYVQEDPREEGIRAHLNLGHTFAHALESCSGLGRYGHGGAVAWGIARALLLGELLGLTPSSYRQRVQELLSAYGYSLNIPEADPGALAEAMERDKKKRAGELRFVLQEGPGKTLLQTVPRTALLEALNATI
jgi:3-dehydroquinate synthase